MKSFNLLFLCLLAGINLACAKFTYGSFDLEFGRALLKKKWKKCTTEKRTEYVGNPIDTIRGVKNSHSCCVKCKSNSNCDRWTYLGGKWSKCTLFNKRDKSVEKVNARYHISGYAPWRLKDKNWSKVKKVAESNKNKDKNKEDVYNPPGLSGEEEVYNPPDFFSGGSLGGGSEEVYNPPEFTPGGSYDGEEVYNPPGFGGDFFDQPGFDNNCDPFVDGLECLINEAPIKDYTRMRGKTLYGRRLNSILNCVGNRASTSSTCESMCNSEARCTGWTWTELDCSWVGDRDLTGVCYLMSETDENDIFDARDGTFISGIVR